MRTGALTVLAVGLALIEIAWGAGGHLPPGSVAVFGFVGCVAIVLVSKLLGKVWLQRPELHDDE